MIVQNSASSSRGLLCTGNGAGGARVLVSRRLPLRKVWRRLWGRACRVSPRIPSPSLPQSARGQCPGMDESFFKERKKKEDFLKEGNREQTNHRPTSKHNSN